MTHGTVKMAVVSSTFCSIDRVIRCSRRLPLPHSGSRPVIDSVFPAGAETADRGGFLYYGQERADIDISPEFNFVRSIRIFDVRNARQYEAGSEGGCERSAVVVLGTYGVQGDFSWQRSSIGTLPKDHVGLERWGDNCPSIRHRSVFVEWRDYEGKYGYEQVNY